MIVVVASIHRSLRSPSRKGETLGIVGESGCGKSTLVHLLLHLVAPVAQGNAQFAAVRLSSAVLLNRASAWAGKARDIVLDGEIAVPSRRHG